MVKSNRKRSGGIILLVACAVTLSISGCKTSFEDSEEVAPARPTVDAGSETKLKAQAEDFVKLLRSGDYKKVEAALSPELQKSMPVAKLTQEAKTGFLQPLSSAGDLEFEPATLNKNGDKATLRFGFSTPTEKNWHMNLGFKKTGEDWKINTIVPPAKPGKPMQMGGKASASN